MLRVSPSQGTTYRSQPMLSSALTICANSPQVRPYRWGSAQQPTKLRQSGKRVVPSTVPPSGLPRSSTTSRLFARAQSSMAFFNVEIKV